MADLVSAIITTYKRKPEIVSRAINSVLNQTYHNIELIVVDDSPDTYEFRREIKSLCDSFEDRIKYIQHKKNMGACVARNTGLNVAKGKYVAFLDDDDEWLPEKIEKQISAINHKDFALVYCGNKFENDGTGEIVIQKRRYLSGNVFDKLIYENFVGSTSFPLIKKECLDEIGGFDPLMESAQDYDVWLRIAQKNKITFIAEPLVTYHVINSERISTNPQKRINGQQRLIEKNREYLSKNKRALWYRKIRLVPNYANNKQLFKAILQWYSAAKICPFEIKTNIRHLFIAFKYYFIQLVAAGKY